MVIKILKLLPFLIFKSYLNPFFIIILLIILQRYKNFEDIEVRVYGNVFKHAKWRLLMNMLYGFAGGLLGSVLVILLGIKLEETVLLYFWPLIFLGAYFHPRSTNYVLPAALLCLFYLIFKKTDFVSQVMVLVAVITLIEGLLMYVDGYTDKVPVFTNQGRKIVGGFFIQKYWPVPFVFIFVFFSNKEWMDQYYSLSFYRDMIYNLNLKDLSLILVPVIGFVGYTKTVLCDLPEKAVKRHGLVNVLFSMILLGFSLLANLWVFKVLVLVLMPVVHEVMIFKKSLFQKGKQPLFVLPEKGLLILDIKPGSLAEKMGLRSGDIILQVNNKHIMTLDGLYEALKGNPRYIWIKVKNIINDRLREIEYKDYIKGINVIDAIFYTRQVVPPNILPVIPHKRFWL